MIRQHRSGHGTGRDMIPRGQDWPSSFVAATNPHAQLKSTIFDFIFLEENRRLWGHFPQESEIENRGFEQAVKIVDEDLSHDAQYLPGCGWEFVFWVQTICRCRNGSLSRRPC